MIALVPSCRGVSESSEIDSSRRARPSWVSPIESTQPTGTPPTSTWSPETSWLELATVSPTWYEPPPNISTSATATLATASAASATLRGRTHPPVGAACRRELAQEAGQGRHQAADNSSLSGVHPCSVRTPRHPKFLAQPIRQQRGSDQVEVFDRGPRGKADIGQARPHGGCSDVAQRIRHPQRAPLHHLIDITVEGDVVVGLALERDPEHLPEALLL